jgi:hypothetical protein
MRTMEIPSFPRKIKIRDLSNLFRTRLSQKVVMWPEQAIPLLGYMCYPNDPARREALLGTLRSWPQASEPMPPTVPKGLRRIQHDWLRVADILHFYYDLVEGDHQTRRGGPSIGKSVTLVATNAKSCGTGAATLWKNWSTYKDVAHLITAATVICADALTRYRNEPLRPDGLSWSQFIPFQMAMLIPDLVLAVGLEFERVGLSAVPDGRAEPVLDPAAAWRIGPDINVEPLPPPARKIRAQDRVVLNSRRAGNRGKVKVTETTPVFG